MTVVTDDFNRADGVLSGNWTQLVGGQNVIISSNQVGSDTAGSYASAYWNANTFQDNQYSQAVIKNAADSFGLLVRAQVGMDRQYYAFRTQFGQGQIFRQTGSSIDVIATDTTPPTFNVNDVLRMEAEGTTIRVLHNDVEFISVTDTTYTGGKPGLNFSFGTTARLDDWEGGDLAAAFQAAWAVNANGILTPVV